MLFKTAFIITAVTTAFAALIACKQVQAAPATQKYTLYLFPGAGALGRLPVTVRFLFLQLSLYNPYNQLPTCPKSLLAI